MRIGFISNLLWPRYGPFWQALLEDTGAEAVFAEQEDVLVQLKDSALEMDAVAFRIAVAQALTMTQVDLILAPDLNPESEATRGGAQDPWIASFPEALAAAVSGLPPVVGVPATLEPDLDPIAVSLLHRISRDPAMIQRVWARHRARAKPPRYGSPIWSMPSVGKTVGLVGQPWLLSDAIVARLPQDDVHIVSQHRLEPGALRAEGWRADERLIATDAEVLGAARLFARRSGVSRLWFLADQASGADLWLLRQVEKLHKPVKAIYLQDLAAPEGFAQLLLGP